MIDKHNITFDKIVSEELWDYVTEVEQKVRNHFILNTWMFLVILGLILFSQKIFSVVPNIYILGYTILLMSVVFGFYFIFKIKKDEKQIYL